LWVGDLVVLGLVLSGGYLVWAYRLGGVSPMTALKIKKGQSYSQVKAIIDAEGHYRRTGEKVEESWLTMSGQTSGIWTGSRGRIVVHFEEGRVLGKTFTATSKSFLDPVFEWLGANGP
jgi:hypothetical protein